MGVIQSGINQFLQTAAIVKGLTTDPTKKTKLKEEQKTRESTKASIDNINELHKGYQEDLKTYYDSLDKNSEGELTPKDKAEFEKSLKEIEPIVQKQIDERANLAKKYVEAGGSKKEYQQYAEFKEDEVNDILIGEPGGLQYTAKDIITPTYSYKGNFNDEMYAKALELAAKQRETYGYVNEELKKKIAKYTEGYNGK